MSEELFISVMREHGPMLSRIVASYEYDRELQDDLLQEVALALWRALPKFEGRSSLRTFVARIAHYRSASHVRRETRAPKPVELNPNLQSNLASAEDELAKSRQRDKLLTAVRALPLGLRQVATLALEGFEAREIAETLGITANNASVRLNRAKRALREGLNNEQ